MRVLRDDVYARRSVGSGHRRRPGVVIFVLILVSAALLVLSRIEHAAVRSVRLQLAEIVAPALQMIAVPLAPLRRLGQRISTVTGTPEELERLRDENQKLKSWEARARELERRLSDLGTLARVVDEPGLEFITGRVIADANGPFARSVLLNAGREQGLRSGYPVVSGDGLVGRVLETGPKSARILLLTDLNSRIPVLIGERGVRGVLAGDNSARPRLAHLPAEAQVRTGEEVVTSGVGGLFPRGLRIGVIRDDDGVPRLEPHARLDDLEHVSVLFHETPALELAGEERRPPAAEAAARRGPGRRPVELNSTAER